MANVQRNSSTSTQSMQIEPMEPREHFSASQLIPHTPRFIGPVRPGSQVVPIVKTTTPSTTKTATPSTPAASQIVKPFALYDSTFPTTHGTPNSIYPGFQQGYWTGAVGMESLSDPTEPYASQKQITSVANLAKNGGEFTWNSTIVQAGALTFLDFETHSQQSVSYYVQRLNWYHQVNPQGLVGIWGLMPGLEGLDRDQVINPTPQVTAQIQAQLKADAPIINAMSVITIPSYMLGPAWVDRDLQWIKAAANIYHQAFPNKPVLAWTWGAYHTAWNPANDVLPDDVTKRLVQTCMDSCNGMVVWGPDIDNFKLREDAVEMDQPALQDSTLPPALAPSDAGSVRMFSDLPITSQLNSLLV